MLDSSIRSCIVLLLASQSARTLNHSFSPCSFPRLCLGTNIGLAMDVNGTTSSSSLSSEDDDEEDESDESLSSSLEEDESSELEERRVI